MAVVLAMLSACGPQLMSGSWPKQLPAGLTIDESASEVETSNIRDAKMLRKWAADFIRDVQRESNASQGAVPARFRLTVTSQAQSYAYIAWIPIIITIPLMGHMWFPAGDVTVTVKMTLDADGRKFVGEGTDSQSLKGEAAVSDLYLEAAFKNALLLALQSSVEQAKRSGVDRQKLAAVAAIVRAGDVQ